MGTLLAPTRMKHVASAATVLAFLGWAAAAVGTVEGVAVEGEMTSEEYKVYAAMLEKAATSGLVVLHDHAVGYPLEQQGTTMREYLAEKLPEISAGLIEDFVLKDHITAPLTDRFSLPAKVVLLRSNEFRELFTTREAWEAFESRYAQAKRVFELSRIGFNTTRDLALVHVGSLWRGGRTRQALLTAGEFYFVLLALSKTRR